MKRTAVLLTVGAAAAALYPAAAGAARFGGVVIAKQPNRHALIVTSRAGTVRTVRTHARIRIGSRVLVNARLLRDGTYRASRVAVRGHARHARIHAFVVRRLRGRLLVSAGHSVFVVRKMRLATMSAADDNSDQPGDEIDATVTVGPNGLDEENETEVGHQDSVELNGSFVSLNGSTLTIQTEDGSTIPVVVPTGFTLPTFQPGQHLELKVSVSGTTFTLVEVKSEDNGDNNDNQGDNNDNQGDNNDQDDGGGGND